MESNKVADFQEITGVQDLLLCHQVLQDHNWNLEAAVSSFLDFQTAEQEEDGAFAASSNWDWTAATKDQARELERFSSELPTSSSNASSDRSLRNPYGYPVAVEYANYRPDTSREADPHVVWKLVDLPLSMARGSYNLVYDTVGMSMDIAGGVLNYGLDILGLRGDSSRRTRHDSEAISSPASDVASFIHRFETDYGYTHPEFQTLSFIEALRNAQRMQKFLFVYIHCPENADTPSFCQGTLCHQVLVEFLNANFVSWGAEMLSKEGQQMSKSFKIQTLPFCAVVTAAPNAQIAIVQQIEGLKSAGELLSIFQGIVEAHGPTAVTFPHVQEDDEQKDYFHLFEEQDVAHQIGFQAYQDREEIHGDEAEQISREEALADCQRWGNQEAAAQADQEAAVKQATSESDQLKRAMALLTEPEKGPDVSQVLLWLPTGERKQHRFESSSKVEAIYDYVDSLGTIPTGRYSLVSNFPHIVYGPDKMDLTLRSVGLHPTASLFVQMK